MVGPTVYPELNAVLREFVESVQQILGENFCGAYLQGSFAVGDADEHSDVDFIVVTHDEVGAEQLADLQAMHERIYAFDSFWAQHLEGSYLPSALLRRVDPSRSPLVYVDNGATELTSDNHCNTAVVRWSLREHGVVLAGPDPKSLVDQVSPDQLRSDVLTALREWNEWQWDDVAISRRYQPLLVLMYCRMLHTLSTGRVTSKQEAGEWALGALDAEWATLIQRALDDRPDPWVKVRQQADQRVVDRTWAFISYAIDRGARAAGRG